MIDLNGLPPPGDVASLIAASRSGSAALLELFQTTEIRRGPQGMTDACDRPDALNCFNAPGAP
jgi:hypothetical protein